MATNGNLPPKSDINSTTEYFNNYFDERFSTSPNINDAVIGYFQSVTGDADTGKYLATTVIQTALSQGLEPMSLVDEFRTLKAGRKIEQKTPIDESMINSTYASYDEILANKNTHPVGQIFYVPGKNVFYQSYYIPVSINQPLDVQTEFLGQTFDANTITIQTQPILAGQQLLDTEYVETEIVYLEDDIQFPVADNDVVDSIGNVQLQESQSVLSSDTGVTYNIPTDVENPDEIIVKSYLDQAIDIKSISNYKAESISVGNGQYSYNFYHVSYIEEQDEITPYLAVLLNQNRVNTSLLGINNTPDVSKYITRSILA